MGELIIPRVLKSVSKYKIIKKSNLMKLSRKVGLIFVFGVKRDLPETQSHH